MPAEIVVVIVVVPPCREKVRFSFIPSRLCVRHLEVQFSQGLQWQKVLMMFPEQYVVQLERE